MGEPDPCIAAANPAAIDSTDTNTTTTPAMPMMATADELSRAGIVRRLSAITARVCLSHLAMISRSPLLSASVIRSRIAAIAGITPASRPISDHQADAERDVARRQHEDRQHAAGRIAVLHEQPGEPQARARRRRAR